MHVDPHLLYNFERAPEEQIGGGHRSNAARALTPTQEEAGDAQWNARDTRILVVEDDKQNAKLLRVLLTQAGYKVYVAGTAERALAMMPEVQPQLMVVDLVLPKMGGVLLAEYLKADPVTHYVVLIAVTSYDGTGAERVARSVGYTDYFAKPFDGAEILKAIGGHLARASQKGES